MPTPGVALFCFSPSPPPFTKLFLLISWKLQKKSVSLQRSIKQIRNDNERRKLYKIRLGDETPAAQQGQLCCA